MSGFVQGTAGVLLTTILVLALGSQGKQTAMLLVLAVCGMVGALTLSYLEPVIEFIHRLRDVGDMDWNLLQILLKAVGIGLIGEVASMICSDSGNAALGKTLQMLSAAVILRLSIPLLEQLLDLLEQILGEV